MNISRKNLLRLTINTLVGLILILLWLKFVNIGEVTKNLKTIHVEFILFFFVFFITSTFLRAARLRLLLKDHPLKLKELVPLNFLSQFLSFIVPIRAGEIARSIYLTQVISEREKEAAPEAVILAESLVWVFLDRFLDFWVFIFLVAILIFIVPNRLPIQSQRLIVISLGGFTFFAIIMMISQKFSQKILSIFSKFLIIGGLKRLFLKITGAILSQFSILKRPPLEFLGLIGLTLLAVLSDTLVWFFVLLSLGINLGIGKTLLGSCLTILTFVIPSAPGYVGTAEASGLAIFSGALGLNLNLASSAVLLSHILGLVTVPIFGIASLYILKFDLGLVWKRLKRS